MILFRSVGFAACLTIAACAAPAPPRPPAPPPEPVDGLYRGTSTRYQADSKNCPRPGLLTLSVLESRFQYRWDHRTYLDGSILPDGTIQGGAPGITLQGRRDGAKLEGDVTNGVCGLHFTLFRKDL